jgi:hypothetical protein
MRRGAPDLLSLVGGVLCLAGWTVPYLVFRPAFFQLAWIPPSHASFFPWIGGGAMVLGVVLVAVAFLRPENREPVRILSTLFLIVGISHLHLFLFQRSPRPLALLDIAWAVVAGVAFKVILRRRSPPR